MFFGYKATSQSWPKAATYPLPELRGWPQQQLWARSKEDETPQMSEEAAELCPPHPQVGSGGVPSTVFVPLRGLPAPRASWHRLLAQGLEINAAAPRSKPSG